MTLTKIGLIRWLIRTFSSKGNELPYQPKIIALRVVKRPFRAKIRIISKGKKQCLMNMRIMKTE